MLFAEFDGCECALHSAQELREIIERGTMKASSIWKLDDGRQFYLPRPDAQSSEDVRILWQFYPFEWNAVA